MDMDHGHECGKLNNKPSSKYPQMVGLLLGFPNYTTMLMGQEAGTSFMLLISLDFVGIMISHLNGELFLTN